MSGRRVAARLWAPFRFLRRRRRIAFALLVHYPSPADARGLGRNRLAAFLARHAVQFNDFSKS